jgi:PhzF family phenazine biosynthesis protein
MNLAETSFLFKAQDGFQLRWFTPEAEVDLCGHATLATAHILFETGALPKDGEAVFFTKSGRLSAKKEGETIWLDFPAEEDEPTELPGALRDALRGAVIFYSGKNRLDYIVEIASDEQLRKLQPDMQALATQGHRGVMVTSASSDPAYDFISRFFAPGVGIPEDPVTGSAHCCLGPYWQRKLGKSAFNAYQASKRGGKLKVEVKGDRVMIGGKAVTVFVIDMPL